LHAEACDKNGIAPVREACNTAPNNRWLQCLHDEDNSRREEKRRITIALAAAFARIAQMRTNRLDLLFLRLRAIQKESLRVKTT